MGAYRLMRYPEKANTRRSRSMGQINRSGSLTVEKTLNEKQMEMRGTQSCHTALGHA